MGPSGTDDVIFIVNEKWMDRQTEEGGSSWGTWEYSKMKKKNDDRKE